MGSVQAFARIIHLARLSAVISTGVPRRLRRGAEESRHNHYDSSCDPKSERDSSTTRPDAPQFGAEEKIGPLRSEWQIWGGAWCGYVQHLGSCIRSRRSIKTKYDARHTNKRTAQPKPRRPTVFWSLIS